jgi:hypothetical protein
MISSPNEEGRAERQARIQEDIRRLFARYRRKEEEPPAPPARRFTRSTGTQRPSESARPRTRA